MGWIMKKFLLLITLLLVIIPLISCGNNSGEVASSPLPSSNYHWPERMMVVSSTGVGETVNVAWSRPLEQATGMTVRVVPEGNLSLRFKWLKEGRFFMAGESTSVIGDVISATREYAFPDLGSFPLRIIYSGGKSDSGYIVRKNSPLQSVKDITKGVRMPEMTFSGNPRGRFTALATWAEIKEEDITWVPFSNYDAMVRAVTEGKIDLAFAFPTSASVYEAEASPVGIRWLELPYDTDFAGANSFLALQPYTSFGIMSQGGSAAQGVKSNSGITLKYVTADADPELVYHTAKWLDENHALYKDAHSTLEDMTLDVLVEGINTSFIPVHDGLIRYLKEKNLWTEAHEIRQQLNLELLDSYMEAYGRALNEAKAKNIAIDPLNEEWIKFWESHRSRLPPLKLYPGIE
jgi:TRAP transporter TAXI family solute receptor